MSEFYPALRGEEQEEQTVFRPKFDKEGYITAIACDADSHEILMLAHMNNQALQKTLETGKAHYWSRSRNSLWLKGETSGNVQMVQEIRVDCDQDAIVMMVKVEGADASCHTGRISCFYRIVKTDQNGDPVLEFDKRSAKFDPASVYNPNPNKS